MRTLSFDCNAECGARIVVDVGGWETLRNESTGRYPKDRVYAWLGERVWSALADHHERCPEIHQRPDGRPDLRLVAW